VRRSGTGWRPPQATSRTGVGGLTLGGGNFGVAVEFEFALHPTGTRALIAEHTFAPDQAAAALQACRDLAAGAPRPATFTASVRDGQVTAGFVWMGGPRTGRRLARQLGALLVLG
jgi:FAD/FMN-containing dehydrogenase